VDSRARDRALLERRSKRGLIDDRTARSIHEERSGLHPRELVSADQAARALAQHEMDGDHVGAREELVALDALSPRFACTLGVEVLAPGEHFHVERRADFGHLRADRAEADDAERLPGQPQADGGLPLAFPCRSVFARNLPEEREDQSPVNSPVVPAAPGVPHTTTPRSRAATRSIEALRMPVVTR